MVMKKWCDHHEMRQLVTLCSLLGRTETWNAALMLTFALFLFWNDRPIEGPTQNKFQSSFLSLTLLEPPPEV